MPRRRSGPFDFLIGLTLVIGLIGVGIAKFFEVVGFVLPTIVVVAAVAFYLWRQYEVRQARLRADEARAQGLIAALQADEAQKQADLLAKARAADAREAEILAKYGDPQVARRIAAKHIWVGQTSEQLRDSVGEPHDIDQRVLKTKKKEIWKYGPKGGGRYMYRITLDNDVVVGWDEKA